MSESYVFEELDCDEPTNEQTRFKRLQHVVSGQWKNILIGLLSQTLYATFLVLLTYFLTKGRVYETEIVTSSTFPALPSTSSKADSTSASTTTLLTPAPSNINTCVFGFTYINGKCWRLFTDPQTRENADSVCMSYGGSTLFSIRNEQENNAIFDFVSNSSVDYFWTGLICKGNTISSCIWDKESGSADGYDNFSDDYPDVAIGECVYFITTGSEAGKWKSGSCNPTMSFICELPPTIQDNNCENNYNNHCYLRYDLSYTVAQSQKFCRSICGNLVSITSANENRYVQSIYIGGGYITLGAVVPNVNIIYWMDGSPATYNNIQHYTNGTCLFLNLAWDSTDHWYTVDCAEESWFLCKRSTGANYIC